MNAQKPTLSHEQYAKAIQAIQMLDMLNQLFDDLEACGEACTVRRQRALQYRTQLEELITRFRPRSS